MATQPEETLTELVRYNNWAKRPNPGFLSGAEFL